MRVDGSRPRESVWPKRLLAAMSCTIQAAARLSDAEMVSGPAPCWARWALIVPRNASSSASFEASATSHPPAAVAIGSEARLVPASAQRIVAARPRSFGRLLILSPSTGAAKNVRELYERKTLERH